MAMRQFRNLATGFDSSHQLKFVRNSPKLYKLHNMKNDVGFVCCHFNPMHFKSKLKCFTKFHNNLKKLNIDITTVELAINGDPFELNNFPNVIKVRSNSILWHKERLLNIGIEKLKHKYKKISWLDADIIVKDRKWSQKISKALDTSMVCQVFKTATVRDKLEISTGFENYGNPNITNLDSLNGYHGITGLGWAARSEVFSNINLYDSAIIGGGDYLNYLGCFVIPHHHTFATIPTQ